MRSIVAELFHPMWLARQFFDYLQDTLIDEFPWLASGFKSLEVLESKSKQPDAASKGLISDLLTIFLISLFLIILASFFKYFKDDDDDDGDDDDTYVPISSDASISSDTSAVESAASSVYSMPLDSKTDYARRDCGDSVLIARIDEIPTIDLTDRDDSFVDFSNVIELDRRNVSILSSEPSSFMRENSVVGQSRKIGRATRQPRREQSQQSQARANEWLVRRTRSGHVYGKYPM